VKKDWLKEIDRTRELLKQKAREQWSLPEKRKIKQRGEQEVDFFRIWYPLCVLERMERYWSKYRWMPPSWQRILKDLARKW